MAAETEEEQIEAVKKWLEENATSMIVTVVLVLGSIFGYRAWENSVQETGEAASQLYDQLTEAVAVIPAEGLSDQMVSTGRTVADQLKNDHDGSVYATFAALHMARVAVEDEDLSTAEAELRWALEHADDDSLEVITRIRLATILAAQERTSEALVILDASVGKGAHVVSWEETRGDILVAVGREDEARQAYQLAVNALDEDDARPYLEMKLENLTYAQATSPTEEVSQVEE